MSLPERSVSSPEPFQMHGLFSHPLNSLDENDLRDLVQVRRVREHIHLDYKKEPYSHSHNGAVEMLADVTALANAQGGFILIGVEEDTTAPDGTPKSLEGITEGDLEAKWIQSVCLASIDEKILGLAVRDVSLSSGRSCIVIQIPNSSRKPHMIVHERHRSFRMRHGRDKSFMAMQEVRSMILSMNTYMTLLFEFLDERERVLKNLAEGQPWLLLMATPIHTGNDKLDPLRKDIREILENALGNPDPDNFPAGISAGAPRPRIFGIEVEGKFGYRDRPFLKYLRLFRNGHLEYCSNTVSRGARADWPKSPMSIYPYEMTVTILRFLEVARKAMYVGEVNEPIAVTLHLENCCPSLLPWWKYDHDAATVLMSGDALIWDKATLSLDLTATDLTNPEFITHALMGRLYTAYGSDPKYNRDFDAQGHFLKSK